MTHELCVRAVLDAFRKKWTRKDYAATIEKYGGINRAEIKKEVMAGKWSARLEAAARCAVSAAAKGGKV